MDGAGWCLFETALGPCGIAWRADGTILAAQLPEADSERTRARMAQRLPGVDEREPSLAVQVVMARMQAALAGHPDGLEDVRLAWDTVTPFHRRVYEITRAIPPGRTRTYGEIAQALGEPGASRAVGQALGLNPFAPIVPCHRVLAAGNAGGGFSADGGVATKLRMLQAEQAQPAGAPDLFGFSL
ncbi:MULTISPECIES: methylated-DNA--[protein]-cysteine S-methyltransferase [Ramlibacter]|uniref:Methylated-DNA--[protein]-cysteine S-methyltransferase n=1 Tax=Ramlibacter aquaticus TaxID=2780094 RepID=A0ABR9SEQ3_9BURK|nr:MULTISPECIES: methylated-DNA--[protein]-cysteine S-methyltransferase [Ramlibacter]MBE7940803.1 methylated-DNA--[protein]-cysteine S-methyltransferase [Ramlibacter aquaticus]